MKQKLHLLMLLFLLKVGSAMAQNIQVLMSPKPSPYISDWQQQTETIKLVITNSTQNVIVVKIKSELLDGSSTVIAATDASKMPELEVSPGVTTFDASDVFPLQAITYKGKAQNTTAQTGRIPDDNYKLCVALTSPQTGQVIGTSGTVCKNFAITAFQAPTLVNPTENQEIPETGVKGIVFRWTPIIPKPRDPVIYRLQVWEVLEGQTPMVALRSNQPIVEKDCKELLQTQWPIENALPEAGKKYVWTITPLDADERKLVDGIGMSEPLVFSILANSQKTAPISLLSPANGAKLTQEEVQNISFRWTPIIPKPRDPVLYKLKVWQLMQGQKSAEAKQSNKPIITKDVDDVTECKISERITFPPGCIWQVEALDLKGNVVASSGTASFTVSSAGCGTNEAKVEIVCDKIIKGVQTYKVSINFNNVAAGGVQTCATIMNAITSTTGVLSSITSLPATIPANGNVAVSFIYTPNSSTATTADFQFKGIWQDGNSNTSNFSKLGIKLPNCKPQSCCPTNAINQVWVKEAGGYQPFTFDFINCIDNPPFHINEARNTCGKDYYIGSAINNCNSGCRTTVIYKLTDNSSSYQISGTNSLIIPKTLTNGNYKLSITFKCGDSICKTCDFSVIKNCKPTVDTIANNCCKDGKWIPPFLTAPAPTLENKLDYVITNDPLRGSICGKDLQNVKCNSYINFRYAYQCATNANCKATITYVFKKGKSKEVLNTFSNIENGRNLAFLTPNVSGYYCMTAYAVCDDKVCDSCTVCFKLDCPPPIDCCKNSVQEDPGIYDAVTGAKVFDLKCAQPSVFRINNSLNNCNKDFVVKASANCAPNAACQSKIVLKINGTGYSNFGTGSIVIPSSLPNGNFILNVDYYCGDKICKSCKFEIVKDCKKDTVVKNCCENSSWDKIYYLNQKAIVNLNPKGAHLGTFKCKTVLPITVNYTCAKNCGGAQIKYELWQGMVLLDNQTIVSGNTYNLTIPTNTTVMYTLNITSICNGIECAQTSYTFTSECPSNSDSSCCGGPDWKMKAIVAADGLAPLPQCGATLGTYKCNVPKSFKFCYDCKQGCGPAKIKYEVINIATSLPEFSNIVSNCTSVSIPMNYANGSYQLNITALCGDKVCATCRYNFKIECPANCCDSSGWKNGLYLFNDRGDILKPIYGGTIETYYINNSNKNCDIPITVWGWFLCNPKMKDCAGNVKYTLFNSAMTPVYSNTGVSLNIPATLSNGTYTLIVEGLCGNTVCRTDKLKIIKDCDQPDCCKGGKWENKNYTISAPLIKTTPIQVSCDKKYETTCLKDGSITFNANYICGTGANCTKKVYAKIYDSDGEEMMNLPLPISFSLINSGNYKITYYAKCGDKICDSCTFWVNIKSCPVKNCCDSSKWGTKTISWPGIKDKFTEGELPTKTSGMKMLPPGGATSYDPTGPIGLPPTSMDIECQMGYTLSQYGKYTFNANYNCADKTCASKVEVKITGTSSSVYNGTFTCPYTQKFDVADNYKIEYIAYCGGQICGRCEFQLLIEKNCCAGSKWISGMYQVVNKKADGTWIWEPSMNYLPVTMAGGIPTYKADLGLDISRLNYQCSDQKGCNVQYLVRRKNLTTGGLVVPDELLPLGQNTTSIYSKPFPQQIWIWGICGGQQCGSPISFKLECLNKDCIPCEGKKSININTGIDASGTVLTSNIGDPFWKTSFTYPGLQTAFVLPATSLKLTPTFNQTSVPGNHTFTRDFYICAKGDFTFSGNIRCDNQLIKLEIIDASASIVWTFTSIPTIGDNLTTSANFMKTLYLNVGKYSVRALYRNRNSSWGTATDGWFELQGSITTTDGGVVNSETECCTNSSSTSLNIVPCPEGYVIVNGNCELINSTEYQEKQCTTVTKKTYCNPQGTQASNCDQECTPENNKICGFATITSVGPCPTGTKEVSTFWKDSAAKIKRVYFISSANVSDGMLEGKKQLLSLQELKEILIPMLKPGTEITQLKIVKTEQEKYLLVAVCKNLRLNQIQTIYADLIQEKSGLLKLAESVEIVTQSVTETRASISSPGGGTCSKCGATFTDEQAFILHQENCEYTSTSASINARKHDYVGHVTLLR